MFSNKSKKAIKSLKNKSSELSEIKNVQQGNNWKASLKDYLTKYIGADSAIIERLENLYFTKKVVSDNPNIISLNNVFDESKKENFRNLIDNAISHIETNGIVKIKTNGNLLSNFNNTELIGGFFVAATLFFSIGNFVGKIEKEREIIDTNTKIQLTEEKYQESIKTNETLKKELDLLTEKLKSK